MKKKQLSKSNNFFLSPFVYFMLILSLIFYGLVIMYSASYYEALLHSLDHDYFLKRQIIFCLLAIIVAIVIHFIDFKVIEFFTYPLLILSTILMIITLVTPYGVTILGARRWLALGPIPSFQPSEIVKVSTILFIAKYYKTEHKSDIIPLLVVIINAILILLQKDYSTTIIYLLTSFALLLICGCDFKAIAIIGLFLILPAFLALFSQGYRIKRIISFVFPSLDPTGLNYQINNSLDAIVSGGLFGKGIGGGTYKLGVLPEVQNDFIFAHLGEEAGFIGIFILILFLFLFTHIGYKVARANLEENKIYSYISFGITTSIVLQAIINMMVVIALMPPTGIALPFFSQGGTNLFFTIILVSIVHKILFETVSISPNINNNDDLKFIDKRYKTNYEEMYFE